MTALLVGVVLINAALALVAGAALSLAFRRHSARSSLARSVSGEWVERVRLASATAADLGDDLYVASNRDALLVLALTPRGEQTLETVQVRPAPGVWIDAGGAR